MSLGLPKLNFRNFSSRFKKLSKRSVIFLTIGVLASLSASLYILFFTGPSGLTPLQQLLDKKPTVKTVTGYKNPFEKSTQFVNPFEKYKSPFYSLKKKSVE